ncbi:MAG: HlyD family secretion protein [Myxococcota bacterium]
MIGTGAQQSALEIARLTRWRGEKWVVRALLAVSIVGTLALLLAPWRQNAVGTGQVIAFSPNERQLSVQAPIDGRVDRWHVQEGDRVEDGQVIVELRDNDPHVLERYEQQRSAVRRRIEAAHSSITALRDRLENLDGLRDRTLASAEALVRVAENNRQAAALAQEAAEAKWRAAVRQSERVRTLADEGLNSQRQLDLAHRNAAQAKAELRASEASVQAARAKVRAERASRDGKAAKLDATIADTREALGTARARLSASEADLEVVERALARQRSLEVRAPRSGMLTHVLAREDSSYVVQGEVLATVVADADQRAVELFIRGNDAPLVVAGQEVRLQFEGWPAIQVGGWPEAAVGTFPGTVAFVEAHASPSGRFRVVVRPKSEDEWPNAQVLRQGNAVNGWILLNRVALGYELWRQLNGFTADLPPEAAQASGYRK